MYNEILRIKECLMFDETESIESPVIARIHHCSQYMNCIYETANNILRYIFTVCLTYVT